MSSSDSGDRASGRVALAAAPAGRRSSSSGRAVQTTSIGTPLGPVDQVVDEVEQPSSAQCRSSKTSTSGPRSASASKKRRQAANASPPVRRPLRPRQPDERPQVRLDPRASASRTAATAVPSFSLAPSPQSLSRMPACALTISPSAQKVTPSP